MRPPRRGIFWLTWRRFRAYCGDVGQERCPHAIRYPRELSYRFNRRNLAGRSGRFLMRSPSNALLKWTLDLGSGAQLGRAPFRRARPSG
jgi:hypothetical protein